MDFIESVVERSYQESRADERRPLFPRKAIDPDAALVEQMRRGDARAAEALVGTYGDRVYRLAMRITGDASDAEEVVQDALWTVSRKIDTFRGAAAFGSWVYRITANAAYQKLRGRRSKRNEVSWEDVAPSFDGQGQHVELAVDWSRRLKDPAIEGELKSVLCGAIDELPQDFRATFLLHDVEGLSSAEIAETLHVKLGTVKSRVQRARLFLRKRLADYMDGTFGVARMTESSTDGDRNAGRAHHGHCSLLATDDRSLRILARNASSMTPAPVPRHHRSVMRNLAILRSWLVVFSVAVALTGCASLDAKNGVAGATPSSLELKVGYGSEPPVELQVPVPDVNADVTQATKEIESRRKGDPLMRDSQEQPAGPPNLDHDVTQGIQSLGVDKALGR